MLAGSTSLPGTRVGAAGPVHCKREHARGLPNGFLRRNTVLPIPRAILNPSRRLALTPFGGAPLISMSELDQKQVLEILTPIRNREFGGDSIVSLGQVADIRICRPIVSVTVALPNVGSEVGDEIREQVRDALLRLPGIERAEVAVRTEVSASPTSRVGQGAAPPVQRSGSARPPPRIPPNPRGFRTWSPSRPARAGWERARFPRTSPLPWPRTVLASGLLDADVYGPSQTTMFGDGTSARRPTSIAG